MSITAKVNDVTEKDATDTAREFVDSAFDASRREHLRFRKAVESVLVEALEALDEERLRTFCRTHADRWDDVADYGWFNFGNEGYVIHPGFDDPNLILEHINALADLSGLTPFQVWRAFLECLPLE